MMFVGPLCAPNPSVRLPNTAIASWLVLLRIPLIFAVILLQQELMLSGQPLNPLKNCCFLGLSFSGCGLPAFLKPIYVWLPISIARKCVFISSGSVWLPRPHHYLTLWHFVCNFFICICRSTLKMLNIIGTRYLQAFFQNTFSHRSRCLQRYLYQPNLPVHQKTK